MLSNPAGIESATSLSPVGRASGSATEAGYTDEERKNIFVPNMKT